MRLETVAGLNTLFYDGSDIFNHEHDTEICEMMEKDGYDEQRWEEDSDTEFFFVLSLSDECSAYYQERQSWEQVIVLDGVTVIPELAFWNCTNIKKVIFANTVIEIKKGAFYHCKSLAYIKLSTNLEIIGDGAFMDCNLYSVFIPPSCRSIGPNTLFSYGGVFEENKNLIIVHVPHSTQISSGRNIIDDTKLIKYVPFNTNSFIINFMDRQNLFDEIHTWVKHINNEETYALHRACSSYHPLPEVIYAIIERKGLRVFNEKNIIGITPSIYLKENPYAELMEVEIIRSYILKQLDEEK